MSRRGIRRIRRPNGSHTGWSAIYTSNNSFISAGQEEQDIVVGTDWFGGAGDANATLLRIRGHFSWCLTNTTSDLVANMHWAVYAVDKDAAAAPLNSVNFLLDEDVLVYGSRQQFRKTSGNTYDQANAGFVELDIKSKRKLDVGKEIRFAMLSDVGGTYTFSARALIRLP